MPFSSPFEPGQRAQQQQPQERQQAGWGKRKDQGSVQFAQLKPVCVQLLGLASSANERKTHDEIAKMLQHLATLLQVSASQADKPTLSPALISYVFFPIAQLLRTLSEPPDRIRRLQFAILGRLADDWWRAWIGAGDKVREQWKVWEQMLMLGAIALTKSDKGEMSEETKLAILYMLQSLLTPRVVTISNQVQLEKDANVKESLQAWEWDGVSDLPDLEDYEREMKKASIAKASSDALLEEGKKGAVYPSSPHVQYSLSSPAARGGLAHVLTASLDLARSERQSRGPRSAGLRLARTLLHTWIAGEANGLDDIEIEVDAEGVPASEIRWRSDELQDRAKAERVGAYLPGVVSTTMRILSTPKISSQVAVEGIELLRTVLLTCLSDEAIESSTGKISTNGTTRSAPPQSVSLEELILQTNLGDTASEGAAQDLEVDLDADSINLRDNVKDTMSRVAIALQGITALSTNENANVRHTMTELSGGFLTRCWVACQQTKEDRIDVTQLLLGWLMDLASNDADSQRIRSKATVYINAVAKQSPKVIEKELISVAQSFPSLLSSVTQDAQLMRFSDRLQFLLRLSSGDVGDSMQLEALRSLYAPDVYQKWALAVVGSFVLERSSATIGDANQIRLQGFETSTSKAVVRSFEEIGAALARLQSQDTQIDILSPAIEYLLNLSARWRTSRTKVTALTLTHQRMSFNAAFLCQCIVGGVARVLDDGLLAVQLDRHSNKVRKQAKRFARQVASTIVEVWQTDEEEILHGDVADNRQVQSWTEEEKRLIDAHSDPHDRFMEYQRGVKASLTVLNESDDAKSSMNLDTDFVSAASIAKTQEQRAPLSVTRARAQQKGIWQARQIDICFLSVLASASMILGPSVKPLLMQAIYPTVSAAASASEDLQIAAVGSLQKIAFAAGYASVQGCLLDHADYILGSASHRLVSTLGQELRQRSAKERATALESSSSFAQGDTSTVTLRSSASTTYTPLMSALSAPLVLLELVRMLGNDVLILIEDAIDEVLDAIDRFHSNEEICENLLSILDRMLEVMLDQEQSSKDVKHETSRKPEVGYQPNESGDFQSFVDWLRGRKQRTETDATEDPDAPPLDTKAEGDPSREASDERQVTRTQEVTVSMLKKAVPFLSHSSRTIRMRSLRLLNRGIELLCRQGLTVEPLSVVSAAWPILMSRLGFSLSRPLKEPSSAARSRDAKAFVSADGLDEKDFFVAVEAVKLVSTLARFLVDYLGTEKMLRQAVPRLLLLLHIVEQADDGQSAAANAKKERSTFLLHASSNEGQPVQAIAAKDGTASVQESPPRALFRPFRPHSPLATLVEFVLITLDQLVHSMGSSITEADLYAFAVHRTLLACLDARQCEPVLRRARHFYHVTLAQRNAALVWLVVRGAKAIRTTTDDRVLAVKFPIFLARAELSLE